MKLINGKSAEFKITFKSLIKEEDIFSGLNNTYPEELLSLKLKKISENTYQFGEYCKQIDDRNFACFISFEFIKMICMEENGFQLVSFHIFQPDKTNNREEEWIELSNAKEIFEKENKTPDFYSSFLHEWDFNKPIINEEYCDNSITHTQYKNYKLKHLNSKKEISCKLRFTSDIPLTQIKKIIKKLAPNVKYSLEEEYKKYVLVETVDVCKSIFSFQTHMFMRMVCFRDLGFNFDSIGFMIPNKKRWKWTTNNVNEIFQEIPKNYNNFLKDIKMMFSEKIEEKTSSKISIQKRDYSDDKTILVTGGAGFIGSHLCKKLLEQGNNVICLDNLFTGRKRNIKNLLQYENFEFIRHDVIEPILLEVDEIYHLACPASPVHYQYNPVKTIKTNVMGTINMLGLAKRVKAKILLASTSEIYGDPKCHPQKESYWGNVNTTGIRSCYDEGKRVAETLMMDYHRQNGVDIRIARIFNTFGPNMAKNDGRVISNFITQALQNQDITIYGDGSQTRSFCYVNDLIRGLIALMDSDVITPTNLGNPKEKTILETAKMLITMCDSKSKIVHKALPSDDPTRRKPDISKAKELLNWKPSSDLEYKQFFTETIEYFSTEI